MPSLSLSLSLSLARSLDRFPTELSLVSDNLEFDAQVPASHSHSKEA